MSSAYRLCHSTGHGTCVGVPLWLRFTTKNLIGYLSLGAYSLFLSLRGPPTKSLFGKPAPHVFFLEVELTHIHSLSINQLYFSQLDLFFVANMLECKTTSQLALACLTESHTVVFGTHLLSQFRVSYLLLLRRKGVYHTCFLKPDMYRLWFFTYSL